MFKTDIPKDDKMHKKTTSVYDAKFKADVIPTCPAYNFLGYGDTINRCLDKFGGGDDDNGVFFDDIDWEDGDAAVLLKGFGDLVDHSFDIKNLHKTNELSTAMNLPMISALNAFVPSMPENAKVCVIGADRGQNVTQCEKARNSVPKDWTFVCIEPSREDYVLKALTKTLDVYPKKKLINKTLQNVMSDGDLIIGKQAMQFDLIIHNLGLHVLCATEEDRAYYVQFVRDYLKADGKLLGTSIDVDAIRRSDDLGMRSPTRSVELVQEYPPSAQYAEGMAYVRVGSTMFRDPVLSMNAIEAMFGQPDMHVSIVPGKYLFRKHKEEYRSYVPQFTIPKTPFWENVARRPELSIVTYVEITKVENAVEPFVDLCMPAKWDKIEKAPENDLARCFFSLNHGRPLAQSDLLFCDSADLWIAPKWDGITGRVCVSQGVAFMHVNDGTFYRAVLPNPHFSHNLRLQVEVLYNPLRVIVVDPYMIGVRSPTTFERRWHLFNAIYSGSFILQSLMVRQEFRKCSAVEYGALRKRLTSNHDGIVIQPRYAMPGSFRDGIGSARYLKDRYTLDVEKDGAIYEVFFDTFESGVFDIVRRRVDKHVPNSVVQMMNIKSAIKIDEFRDHLSLSRFAIELEMIPSVLRVLAGDVAYEDIPQSERMTIYRGRFDDWAVARDIITMSADAYKRRHYNMYMDIKNRIIKDIIVKYQNALLNNAFDPRSIKNIRFRRDGGVGVDVVSDILTLDMSIFSDDNV